MTEPRQSQVQLETFPSSGVAPDNKARLLISAQKGDWGNVRNIINECASTYRFITEAVDPDGRTILHHACLLKENKQAFQTAKEILDQAETLADSQDELAQFDKDLPPFLNKAFYENQSYISAIHIAARRKNKRLVELLLENEANVNLPKNGGGQQAIQLIYKNLPKVILGLFDNALILTDDEDKCDELLKVEWDFTLITGVLPYNDEKEEGTNRLQWLNTCQTFMLSNALRQKELSRSDVVLHPLVQIFLYYKLKKFNGLIGFSMTYHIMWFFFSIVFNVLNARFPGDPLTNANFTNANMLNTTFVREQLKNIPSQRLQTKVNESNYERIILIVLGCVYAAFYILSLTKECLELYYCPSLKYYWKQLENCGQWILLISVFLVGCISVAIECQIICNEKNESCRELVVYAANVIATVGIYSAGMLVLGQFNKTKLLGIYMEMLSKVTKNILGFLLSFSPLLITYVVIFRLLMPNVPQFGDMWVVSKVMTMMVGEVNYDEVFHGDDSDDTVPLPGLTKFLFLCFVVTVVIVLQNLLIGLTLSDIEKLNKYAEENHYAKVLESIYLLENFLLLPKIKWVILKLRMGRWLEGKMVEPIGSVKKLQELPDEVQEIISKEISRCSSVKEVPGRFTFKKSD